MDAVIFGGGVAKGAFGAGALAVLAKTGLRVRRIVGTSSGALNAAYLASAVRSGALDGAGDELARIWLEEGTLTHGFNVSLRGIVDFEGVSTSATLLSLLRRHIRPSTARHPVGVRIVTTNSAGERGTLEPGRQGTTFEHVLRYEGATFDSETGLEALFDGVAASAAFPGAFVPFPLEVGGKQVPCFDGGLTDNTSVKQAIDGAPDVDRVFVIVPYPTLLEPAPERRGLALAAHLVEILTEERYLALRAIRRTLRVARRITRSPHSALRITAAFKKGGGTASGPYSCSRVASGKAQVPAVFTSSATHVHSASTPRPPAEISMTPDG